MQVSCHFLWIPWLYAITWQPNNGSEQSSSHSGLAWTLEIPRHPVLPQFHKFLLFFIYRYSRITLLSRYGFLREMWVKSRKQVIRDISENRIGYSEHERMAPKAYASKWEGPEGAACGLSFGVLGWSCDQVECIFLLSWRCFRVHRGDFQVITSESVDEPKRDNFWGITGKFGCWANAEL